MKLTPAQTDEVSLSAFGHEAVAMLMRGEFHGLASLFGYVLSQDRDPAAALEADYVRAAASPFQAAPGAGVSVVVKYFKPNDTGLFAVVECTVPVERGAVHLDLIVAGKGEEKGIAVEDIHGLVY